MTASMFLRMVFIWFMPNAKDEPRPASGRAVFLGIAGPWGAEKAWANQAPLPGVGARGWFGVGRFFLGAALTRSVFVDDMKAELPILAGSARKDMEIA